MKIYNVRFRIYSNIINVILMFAVLMILFSYLVQSSKIELILVSTLIGALTGIFILYFAWRLGREY